MPRKRSNVSVQNGTSTQIHSEECRKRMEELVRNSDSGQIRSKRAEERANKYIERKFEESSRLEEPAGRDEPEERPTQRSGAPGLAEAQVIPSHVNVYDCSVVNV